jgi:hypothetical protein
LRDIKVIDKYFRRTLIYFVGSAFGVSIFSGLDVTMLVPSKIQFN